MKTAAAYIRVSTDDQTEYSPDSQRKAILDYANRHDMLLPEEFIFTDIGISGRSVRRQAFQKMIGTAKLKPKPFDVILVWKFSRFARNREDSIVYKSMLRKQYGIEIISVSEPLGEDKTSVLIEALLEAMDEYYSINLAEEVLRGMTEKARRGGVMGGQPFGYQSQNGKIIVEEASARIVRNVFQDFVSGIPVRQIADNLNTSGICTSRGNPWDSRGIEYLLRNIAYLGKSHWTPESSKEKHNELLSEKTIIADSHEAIIPEALFRQAQERLAVLKRNSPYKAHPHHGRVFLFKGLCRCSNCHATLVRNSGKGVQCHQYTTGKCHISHFITFGKLNALILQQMQNDFSNIMHSPLAVLLKCRSTSLPCTGNPKFRLNQLHQQMNRIKKAYASGVDTLEEYKENKLRIQKQIDALQKEPDSVPVQNPPSEDIKIQLRSAVRLWFSIVQTDFSDEIKNRLFRAFIREIVFDRKQNTVRILYVL